MMTLTVLVPAAARNWILYANRFAPAPRIAKKVNTLKIQISAQQKDQRDRESEKIKS